MSFLDTLFGKLLLTFGMSMVPVLELRGAIPAGIAAGLPPAAAFVTAVIGNLVPVPFIMLLIRRIFALLRRRSVLNEKIDRLEKRAHLKGRVVRKYRLPGLIILVGIPLPGTGAWTGALVAALLDIRLRDALPAILLGLVIAGGITTAVTMGLIHLF
ncbi:MAG: small multi-drug export protein [Oscillibacter sp.]|nr:small multi-drug export protein [Oscillibacter sp.]